MVDEDIKNGDFMRKFYRFLSCALLAVCTANNLTPTIKSIESYNQVKFENITDPATLVLFDVDETLIQPEDTYLMNEHSEKGLKFRESLIQKYPQIREMHDIGGLVLAQAARPLIEKEVINKIRILKQKNINVFAITAMNTGKYSDIERMEKWRYAHLKKLGFEGTYQSDDFYLQGFKGKPVFYKSIIATDLEDKGKVLIAVLDKLNLKPQKIIMFDDTLEFLYSVEKECKKRGINFFGYHYNGAKKKDWDENVISFQAEYLIQHKKWLSDSEAKEKMTKKTL